MVAHAAAESPFAFLRAQDVDADSAERLGAGLLVLDGLPPQDAERVRAARPRAYRSSPGTPSATEPPRHSR